MGLGKTLTVLALILATREDPRPNFDKATLIGPFRHFWECPFADGPLVAPLSVISNWSTQVDEHVTAAADVKVHVYHGAGRSVSSAYLKKCDIVITTYQCVTGDMPGASKTKKGAEDDFIVDDVKKRKTGGGSLFDIKWKVSSEATITKYILNHITLAYRSR